MNAPQLLEAAMLVCFGLAWPVANLRMLRTRRVEGRGMVFTMIILCDYIAGSLAKLAGAAQGAAPVPMFWLYALNTTVGRGQLRVAVVFRTAPARAGGGDGRALRSRRRSGRIRLSCGQAAPQPLAASRLDAAAARPESPPSHSRFQRGSPTPTKLRRMDCR